MNMYSLILTNTQRSTVHKADACTFAQKYLLDEQGKRDCHLTLNLNETVVGKVEYAYLDEGINHGALIDACSCYIDVNPKTKDIVLSYRYTDVVEFYNSAGQLKYALQGPDNMDIVFKPTATDMGKTKNTKKTFVNTYVTDKNVYLLYSGCNRTDENWVYGSQIFVYSWDGVPQKCYLLDCPIYTIYTFVVVDESRHLMYSYSMRTGELIKGNM